MLWLVGSAVFLILNFKNKFKLIFEYFEIDIDECADNSTMCQQVCINTQGSFRCSCFGGFELTGDSRTCQGSISLHIVRKI